MTSNFASAMQQSTTTWNGAKSLATPDVTKKTNGRISLYFKAIRGLNIPSLYQYLQAAAKEDLVDTFILVIHIRDCRGGKGERELGRRALVWLFLNYPQEMEKIMYLLPEYGRWDDLMYFWPHMLNLSDSLANICANYYTDIPNEDTRHYLCQQQENYIKLMGTQLCKDHANMQNGQPVTICAKWAPTEKDSLDKKYSVLDTLCHSMNLSRQEYRKKYISPLRQYLNVVEKYMCTNQWDSIEFSKVPSCAMKRLKKAFKLHAPDIFQEWCDKLQKGEVKIKAKQLFAHELIQEVRCNNFVDVICAEQWKVLENNLKNIKALQDTLVVVDVSGSMFSWGYNNTNSTNNRNFLPIDVSIALGLLVSNAVQGVFHNHIITFNTTPTFHVIPDAPLLDRYRHLTTAGWGGSTNIQATFDLILNKALAVDLAPIDMPTRVFIISDMQFNCADSGNNLTNFQVIDKKYGTFGYKRPDLIFWNVNGSIDDFPVTSNDDGTAMISGFSANILQSILQGKTFTPYTIMRETLDSERYNNIRSALVENCIE